MEQSFKAFSIWNRENTFAQTTFDNFIIQQIIEDCHTNNGKTVENDIFAKGSNTMVHSFPLIELINKIQQVKVQAFSSGDSVMVGVEDLPFRVNVVDVYMYLEMYKKSGKVVNWKNIHRLTIASFIVSLKQRSNHIANTWFQFWGNSLEGMFSIKLLVIHRIDCIKFMLIYRCKSNGNYTRNCIIKGNGSRHPMAAGI